MIILIFQIRNKIRKGEYRLSDHALKRMIQRSIERLEIEEAVLNGEIIEDYPDDKYAPSCLICGKTNHDRVLHVHVSLPPKIVVITTYEPDVEEWLNCRFRR